MAQVCQNAGSGCVALGEGHLQGGAGWPHWGRGMEECLTGMGRWGNGEMGCNADSQKHLHSCLSLHVRGIYIVAALEQQGRCSCLASAGSTAHTSASMSCGHHVAEHHQFATRIQAIHHRSNPTIMNPWQAAVRGPGKQLCMALVSSCAWPWEAAVRGPGKQLCMALGNSCAWPWETAVHGPGRQLRQVFTKDDKDPGGCDMYAPR